MFWTLFALKRKKYIYFIHFNLFNKEKPPLRLNNLLYKSFLVKTSSRTLNKVSGIQHKTGTDNKKKKNNVLDDSMFN